MLAAAPTTFAYRLSGDPARSFKINSETMLIECENGKKYDTPSFWHCPKQLGEYVPLTLAERRSMNLKQISYPALLSDQYFRFVCPVNGEPCCVYFKPLA